MILSSMRRSKVDTTKMFSNGSSKSYKGAVDILTEHILKRELKLGNFITHEKADTEAQQMLVNLGDDKNSKHTP